MEGFLVSYHVDDSLELAVKTRTSCKYFLKMQKKSNF